MSIAEPQNREEFKKFILTKLGHPVLEINVADEQMDIAISEAFQYFNERNHFNGVERVYLTTQISQEFKNNWRSYKSHITKQEGGYEECGLGRVKALTLENPGSGYPATSRTGNRGVTSTSNQSQVEIAIGADPVGVEIAEDPSGDAIIVRTTTTGQGQGLRVIIDPHRTSLCGITSVQIYDAGRGYMVGDYVTIAGGGADAVFLVAETTTKAENFPIALINEQNNFITLPRDVVGVTKILRSKSSYGMGGGMLPPGMIEGGMIGNILGGGGGCDNTGFGLSQYYAAMSYMALIEFLMYPPKMYNFNQRTHHLHIDGDLGDVGQILCLEVMMKPSPDVYPDLWNDMWLKEFAYALTKAQWGRNLTKYNQVQLPGGIVINGDRILTDAQQELQQIKDRFSMDWMDPPLDEVG